MSAQHWTPLAARILAHAQRCPSRSAVVCDGEAISYERLTDRAWHCAARLRALGLAPGDDRRVAILSSNSIDFAVVVVACQFAGVAVAPISGMIAADAQARLLDDSNAAVLFYDADHAEQAAAAIRLLARPDDLVAVQIGRASPAGAIGEPLSDQWLGSGTIENFQPVDLEPEWVSDLIYSSGTTGLPKGIVQSYAARSAANVALAGLGISDSSRVAQTVSLYSNYGLVSLYVVLWWAGTLHISRKFSAAGFVDLVARESIDMVWFVPATLVRAMSDPRLPSIVESRPCIKICMGAPLSKDTKQAALAAWPGAFIEGYGQTETSVISLLQAHAVPEEKLGSVGKVLASACVRIIDDAGRELPCGAIGEIAAHTSTMMSGYFGRSDANAATYWNDATGRRFVRTGDIGKLDEDGFLWLCDRKKDMIISGGLNIYPADIERELQAHPAVLEAAVVGCASRRWGETPVAVVTPRVGTEATEEEIRAWVNRRVGKAQRVAAVRLVSTLPTGTMGKVLKRELREQLTRELGTLP
ncbi:MAG: 4-coumarate--CoA ligase [Gammaproteobacteria bacterium]|nr:MAG: 4-coumarate--CoA ligase [Gammaproteobacteria bacterium]